MSNSIQLATSYACLQAFANAGLMPNITRAVGIKPNNSNPKTFATYRVYQDGTQERSHYTRNLSLEEALDIERWPLGIQHDENGRPYVWTYGANNGEKF